jgi:hypothetical protein
MNDDRVFLKCAWRLISFMMPLYVVNFVDRVNVGFAALTMNKDLDFSLEERAGRAEEISNTLMMEHLNRTYRS